MLPVGSNPIDPEFLSIYGFEKSTGHSNMQPELIMTTAEPGVLGDLGTGRQSCHIEEPPMAPQSYSP